MGGSSSTRRVVVEDGDGSGVVKISDSVVKRIRGLEDPAGQPKEEPPVQSPPPPPPRATPRLPEAPAANVPFTGFSGRDVAALHEIEAFYSDRLKQLAQQNAELQKITQEQFVKAVQEVEQKFLKHTSSPVCQDLQSKVYECYLTNPGKTLNCSAEVRAFSTCVERARQNALIRKG